MSHLLNKIYISKFQSLFFACRPKQWTKNFIVFLAPLFAFSTEINVWISTFQSFTAFCLISSSIYLINDSIDLSSDRNHPIKKYRPIASGLVSIKIAILLSVILLVISLLISFNLNNSFTLIIIVYFLIQIAYCLILKKIPLLEFFCVSSGFIFRSTAGGMASDIRISSWFLLSVGMLSLFLAIKKRKAELVSCKKNNIKTRKVLKSYSLNLIDKFETIISSCTIFMYSLWAYGPIVGGAKSPIMLITVPLVILGIFRYQMLEDNIKDSKISILESPENVIYADKPIQLIVFSWLFITIFIGFLVE